MATNADFIEYVREQVGGAGEVAFRRMFGEYAVYLDGKVVALVCDNQFYLKPTDAGRSLLGMVNEAPPYPGGRPWFRLDAALEDPEQMSTVLRVTARALPARAPGRPKAARRPRTATPRPTPKAKAKAKKPESRPKAGSGRAAARKRPTRTPR